MLTSNQQEIQLGTLKLGTPYSFHYTLKNEFPQPLNITSVVTGCSSCTSAYINKAILAQGETADLTATFTPNSTGIQSKNISVGYKLDNQNPDTLVLNFKASVDG